MAKSTHKWHGGQAIYLQLMQEVVAGILDRSYREGEMLPSVRQLADAYDVNPLTAARAYRELARAGLLETLRGEGVVVRQGARASLLRREQARFLKEEWPLLRKRLERLELNLKALIEEA